jgi:ElaB/YqjD/DUF883 family membrane-anchored ribosome-binding protein
MSAIRSKKELEKAIENDKQQLQKALSQLGECVKDEVDPRVRVAKSPYVALGISFGIGFFIAAITTPNA